MEQDKKNVFISYSRADYKDENKNVIPGNPILVIKEAFDKAGITYWFDEDGVFAGDTFAPEIARAIHNCDIFLYISSERSNASEWTSNEIATAHAYKKKIIPFRVDNSVYNESVIIFIAKLDYIDYASNQSLAISRLVSGVTDYLTRQKALAEEKERKDKAEKERIRLLKEKEQAELATEIELSARELNTDEGKAQDKRRRITRNAQKIEDEETRTQLIELIDQSGPIHLAHKHERAKMSSEINSLKEEIELLNSKGIDKDTVIVKKPISNKILIFTICVAIVSWVVLLIPDKESVELDKLLRENRYLENKLVTLETYKFRTLDLENKLKDNPIIILGAELANTNSVENPDTIIVSYKELIHGVEDMPINIIAEWKNYKNEIQYKITQYTITRSGLRTEGTFSIPTKELFKNFNTDMYIVISFKIMNGDQLLYKGKISRKQVTNKKMTNTRQTKCL